jgi:hypothetical protein
MRLFAHPALEWQQPTVHTLERGLRSMVFKKRVFLRLALGSALSLAVFPADSARLTGGGSHRRGPEVHFKGKQVLADLLSQANAGRWAALPMGQLVGQVAASLLDTPYVNHTLDHSADTEFCIVNLQELDCVTFVEASLALARSIKLGKPDVNGLAKQIELIRYRNGYCSGFCARLHYLTDWFHDNQRKGIVSAFSKEIPGALKMNKKVSLMSSRPKQYVQLRKHPEWIPIIAKDEKAIWRQASYYVPKAKVAAAEQYMQTGDVIAITTKANILDCAHTGFCYRDDKGVLRFLHASLKHHKVYLDDELSTYLNSVNAFTGVMVARPIEPMSASVIRYPG